MRWQAAARGEIDDARLIVVDEAHETSYRQDIVPRYDAVAVVRERTRRANGVVVLGSATPSLEDYARAKAGRFALVRVMHRAPPRSRYRKPRIWSCDPGAGASLHADALSGE
jgi:primosomal protein N' (replication factor Y)